MSEERKTMQVRTLASNFQLRDDGEAGLFIEGYFAVFNTNYDLFEGGSESIAPGAFTEALDGDVRALIDHETRLVIGRTTAKTLELREDDKGLWGRIKINPNDSDAMNLYERVKRGDVNQCSFGFDILDEETEFNGDNVHWTIKKVFLYEVSVCTFPAYKETSVEARKSDYANILKRKNDAFKADMLAKIQGKETENA